MSLPEFMERTLDALTGLPVAHDRDWFRQRLESSSLTLAAAPGVGDHPAHRSGFLLAANLAGRLYPRIQLDASAQLCDEAELLIRAVNPDADVARGGTEGSLALLYGMPSRDESQIGVCATGWRVELHPDDPDLTRAAGPAALAAAAIGSSEISRQLIRDALPVPKRRPSPAAAFNLIDWTAATYDDLVRTDPLDLGRLHLVGAGAIGEGAALAFGTMPLSGELLPVDHEAITTSNLQRYVLATADDVGHPKTSLIARHLGTSALRVTEVPTR